MRNTGHLRLNIVGRRAHFPACRASGDTFVFQQLRRDPLQIDLHGFNPARGSYGNFFVNSVLTSSRGLTVPTFTLCTPSCPDDVQSPSSRCIRTRNHKRIDPSRYRVLPNLDASLHDLRSPIRGGIELVALPNIIPPVSCLSSHHLLGGSHTGTNSSVGANIRSRLT